MNLNDVDYSKIYGKIYSKFIIKTQKHFSTQLSLPINVGLHRQPRVLRGTVDTKFSSGPITEFFHNNFFEYLTNEIDNPIYAQFHYENYLPFRNHTELTVWGIAKNEVPYILQVLASLVTNWRKLLSCVEGWRGYVIPDYAEVFYSLPDFHSVREFWLDLIDRDSTYEDQSKFIFEQIAPHYLWFLSSFNFFSHAPFFIGTPRLFLSPDIVAGTSAENLIEELLDRTGLVFEHSLSAYRQQTNAYIFSCQDSQDYLIDLNMLGVVSGEDLKYNFGQSNNYFLNKSQKYLF